jgi:hypothetical protein
VEAFSGSGLRRMIYAHRVRMEKESVFGAFDCPDAGQTTGRRRQSTTPLQALNLMNSRFTLDQADALAARIAADTGAAPAPAAQVERAFVLVLGREPIDEERAAAEDVVRDHGPAALARVLFNTSEFLFLP